MATTWYPYDNGTVGATGPEGPQGPTGPAGTTGVVQSVNGQSVEAVVLDAADVGALPSTTNAQLDSAYMSINRTPGNYRAYRFLSSGVSRWELQADDAAESTANAGSDFRLSARADDGSYSRTAIHAKRSDGTISFGLTTHHGSAQVTSNGSVGLRDVGTDPATASGGVFLYSKSGVPYFKNADGTSFQVQPVDYPVNSVNGEAGHVTLGASDVGAMPATDGEIMQTLPISGAPESSRTLAFRTNGQDRWTFAAGPDAETGTDAAGSNLTLASRNDDSTFRATVLDVNRSTGQVAIGGNVKLSDAKATVTDGIGVTDRTLDPATPSQGFVLYAKDGLPYMVQADGTVFQVGVGGSGGVQSVNGQVGIVDLAAEDVGAIPVWGGVVDYSFGVNAPADTEYGSWYYKKQGITRWVMQVNGSSETGADEGSNWALENYDDAGNWKSASLYAKRSNGNVGVGTTTLMTGSKLTVNGAIGARNLTVDPTVSSTGAQIFSKAGKLYVQESTGTVFQVAAAGAGAVSSVNGLTGAVSIDLADLGGIPATEKAAASGVASLDSGTKVPIAQLPDIAVPSSFTPESLGMKAWVSDPALCASGFDYPGVGKGRMAAVYVDRPMSVSKIAWHFFGYAGGLLSGSWAGIYNTSGTLMRATGSMSTATYEPAEQHDAGGGMSTSNLTSAITLSPGVYYILWRFNYTASPVDGPALARLESSSVCQSIAGVGTTVWRHGSYTTAATSAPASITIANLERDSIRFWAALA